MILIDFCHHSARLTVMSDEFITPAGAIGGRSCAMLTDDDQACTNTAAYMLNGIIAICHPCAVELQLDGVPFRKRNRS